MLLSNCVKAFGRGGSIGFNLLKDFGGFRKQITSVTNSLEQSFLGQGMMPVRFNQRGKDYKGNLNKRQKTHGKKTRMKTVNGKLVLMRRMLKGVPHRSLTV